MPVESRAVAALFAAFAAALVLANHAPGATVFGVADDHPKFSPDGGRVFFSRLQDLGMTEDRVTVLWDSTAPTAVSERVGLERMLVQARAHKIDIVFALYPKQPNALARTGAVNAFSTWAAGLARMFPQVRRYIVGNEFNQPRFFQPQFFSDCRPASGATYMELLAKTYDAVKAVDSGIRIVTSVSPRGNDNCNAQSNISRSPYRFIYDMGVAYRAMGRDRPAWDEWGLHAYPNEPTDPLTKGFAWPNMNYANLGRLKQALWDAFASTPQPTFGNTVHKFGQSLASLVPTSVMIAETGCQTQVSASARGAYFGKENVRVTSEQSQAQVYGQLVRTAACDSDLRSVLIFGLSDEPDLDRFQSGLVRANGTPKPSYASGEARDRRDTWDLRRPHDDLEADPERRQGEGRLREAPQAVVEAPLVGLHRRGRGGGELQGRRVPDQGQVALEERRTAIVRGLAWVGAKKPVLKSLGLIRAYWSPLVRFQPKRLRPGFYVYGVQMTATMNPNRHTFFTSRPFKVKGKLKPRSRR